ncbi:hypothetical protein MTBBW1_60034 [Desulfamplus magnetovallimortis]|uniref:Uncharacterized protein n=1 Tax=Desulfamplus magnetovallimortis TaxID=1246637 RepID=A0A1W1HI35_9BACT|nr:hypothetical protein [Desulfamplus magnetovallimortis]SLM32134.1 hypothetical protein MTBBW1_60034 [Desulfamplus magnetovallimortis]
MQVAGHDEFIVEELKRDPEFLELYIEDVMKEKDPFLFKEGLQYIIKAKGFNFDLEIRIKDNDKEAA